jgi:hypothetical protein
MEHNRDAQVKIDTEIAKDHGAWFDLAQRLYTLRTRICNAANCRDVEYARTAFVSGEFGGQGSVYYSFFIDCFKRYDELCVSLDEAKEKYKSSNANYGGWSRFFLVRGGHIHSSLSCTTCNKNGSRTAFQWLTELSGLTEEDAVAKYGAVLCTVCFPNAPVEYTNGKR